MPLYIYQCTKCGYKFETIQKFGDEPLKSCPASECTGDLKKVISAPNIELKGECWARDNYSKKKK